MFMQKLKKSFRSKRGSSLPMVVAIGLVLVIWTMSLSPIVATQGKASIDVQNQEEDYLQSRSAIEFTKGELVNMVENGAPGTFAVLKGENEAHPDDYSPIIYKNNPAAYTNHVNHDGLDHDDDTPKDDKVAAICSVKDAGGGVYNITVTTYCDGKENLSFVTTYTAPYGPGTIYPEAYKKTQALPISDFVLVDGKLGGEVLWDSPLTNGSGNTYINYLTGKADSFRYASTFKELLSEPNADNKFPDAGTYPAVFKFTAGVPTRTYADSERADTLVPGTKPATPTVTVESAILFANSTLEVTLKQQPSPNTSYALYCCRNKNGDIVASWQSSCEFTLPNVNAGDQFFFYCYIMEHVSGNSMIPASDVSDAAPIAVFNLNHNNRASSLSSGKQYLMYCDYSRGKYKLIKGNGSSLTTQDGSDGTLYVYGDASAVWTATGSGSNYQFKLGNKLLNFSKPFFSPYGQYLLDTSDSYFITTQSSNTSFTIKNSNGWPYYFLDPSEDDFCSSSERKLYFYPIDVSINTPAGKPEPLTITIPVFSLTPDEETTLTTIRNHYLSQCTSRGVLNPKIYVVKTGNANEYAVYVSGTYNGMSIFVWLDDLILIKALSLGYGIQGESLYFMGTNVAFDTATKDADNNTIYEPINVVADLLVIRADTIAENGPVIVSPYSPSKSKTLVFFVNGAGLFADHEFYLIESGTDLCSVTAADFGTKVQHVCDAPVKCEDPDCDEGTKKEPGAFIFSREALTLSRNTYPAINLDIAYASDEQLGHIVSGEAIGWTSGGTWRSSTNDEKTDNALYVVCPYVNNVSGSINCSANRIMLAAAPNAEGNRQLTVPANMTLYARYISFTADEIVQDGSSNTELTVKTLLDNRDFLSMLSALLRTDVDYNSKTLQIEYEQQTTFTLYGAAFGEDVPALICRYPSPTDLFKAYDTGAEQDLTALYQVSDLNDAFDDALNIKTVERYIEITGSETLKVPGYIVSRDLNLYANYISFDTSVSKILLAKGLYGGATGDLFINTQESGYTEQEYLSFFKTTSADNYNGTILNIKNPAGLTVINGLTELSRDRYTLPNGCYIVWAEDSGTSIYEIAKDVVTNPESKFRIKTEDLKKYAESIEDNKAYVDAGLEDTGGVTGGFGGGSVK